MDNGRADDSQAVAVPAILTGAETVARVERAIVGDALAGDPAVAEGLALAGVPAASVVPDLAVPPEGATGLPEASCVHHVTAAPGRAHGAAFELAATSAQDAADHCLAAHLLSRRLGQPGLCSLSPSVGNDLALVRLPAEDAIAEWLGGPAGSPERGAAPERIVELAREALVAACAGSERAGAPVLAEGASDAGVVLVAAGAAVASVRAAAQTLSQSGIPARSLALILVRPLPVADLRKALAGARCVFVVAEPGEGASPLLAAVRATVGEKSEVRSVAATGSTGLIGALREALPECGFDPSRLDPPEAPPLAHRLVVAPDSAWGEETARRALTLLARRGPLRIGRRWRRHRGAAVIGWSGGAIADVGRDLLLVSHPGALDPDGALSLLRPGGAVLVLSEAATSPELTQQLGPGARAALRERGCRVHWVGLEGDRARKPAPGKVDRAASLILAAAAIAVLEQPEDPTAAAAEGEGWPSHDAPAIHSLDPADLAADPPPEEVDFRTASKLPRMPAAVEAPDEREAWARWLGHFHHSGTAEGEPALLRPVLPAALSTLAEATRRSSSHPFVVVPGDGAERPTAARGLRDLLADGLETLTAAGREARSLADNLEPLATSVARRLVRRETGAPLDELLSETGDELAEQLRLADDEAAAFRGDLAALRAALPEGSRIFDLRADTPVRLYLAVLSAIRAPLERRFAQQLAQLRDELRDRLRLDRMSSGAGLSPEALTSELGGEAARHLDLDALSETLPQSPDWAMLGERRRRRIEAIIATIEHHLEREEPLPQAFLLRPPGVDLHLPGSHESEHPDPLAAAVGYFDGAARNMAPLFAAIRRARLEIKGSYRPEVHDAALDGLGWEAFSAEELALLPAVTVVTSGRRLRRRGQGSLSELLRSSRPVHVIVCDDFAAADEAEDLSLYHLDLGHLVMAHRETFAVSSTLARPERLVERLTRMFREPRPGVLLVPLASAAPAPWRPLLAEAALQGRASPDFLYDPDAGHSWADRFEVDGNPEPESAWPIHRIAYLEDEAERTLETAFTFADAVALEPAYLRHLRTIPRVAWQDDVQVPLAQYIANFEPGKGTREIPFLWVIDNAGNLQRAVVTRELALACRDRLRGWRVLQELGGFENAYAERAAAAAREAALDEAARERDELNRAHAETLAGARSEGASESMRQLAAALLNRNALAATAPAAVTVAPPAAVAAAETAPALEAEEEEEAGLALDDPYIDTILCTSCNECTNLNSRLFQYNGDKQAFIADAAAGSFAELVKGAKLCPARCIHPGKPRSDDTTATPELIALAAEYS